MVSALALTVALLIGHVAGKDPDFGLNMSQLVTKYGYPIEEHSVTTQDGYILGVFRIPFGKKSPANSTAKPVVFLQHGLEDSSWDWFGMFPNESLGYMLADAGYDVWCGNTRGNFYSEGHQYIPYNTTAYWAFTFDQHANADLPAMMDYVLDHTGQKDMSYIGHSQGTLMGFSGFSSNQVLGDRVKVFIALAPIAYVRNLTSPVFRALSELDIDEIFYYFDQKGFFVDPSILNKIDPEICRLDKYLCNWVCELLFGPSQNLNETRFPVYAEQMPSGTSTMNMVHWAQMVRHDKFQMYDYGPSGNVDHYGTKTPPQYHLSDVNVDTVLYTGSQDALADPTDVRKILAQMNANRIVHHVNFPTFAHGDFMAAPLAAKILYPDVLEQLKKYNP